MKTFEIWKYYYLQFKAQCFIKFKQIIFFSKITKSLHRIPRYTPIRVYYSTITQHGSFSTVNCEMLTQDVKNNGKPLRFSSF